MRIVFRTDASQQIGLGHLTRCLSLAQALRDPGNSIWFVCRSSDSANAATLVEEHGFQTRLLPCPEVCHDAELGNGPMDSAAALQDAEYTRKLLPPGIIDWLIVDHYGLDARWHAQIRGLTRKILVIDDLANRQLDCDLLVNQNLGRTKTDYQEWTASSCRLLLGPSYALLRPQFEEHRRRALKRRQRMRSIKKILVCLGGMDATNQTSLVVEALENAGGKHQFETTIVLSRQAPHLSEVEERAAKSPLAMSVETDVRNMAALMSDADLAIGAAGTSSWERCCLGLPTLVVAVAANQTLNAEHLAQRRAAMFLSSGPELQSQLSAAVKTVIESHQCYREMAIAASNICDGWGSERVTFAMNGLVEARTNLISLLPATAQHCDTVYEWQIQPGIREFSRKQSVPSKTEHLDWFKRTLLSEDRKLFMIAYGSALLGCVRLDRLHHAGGDSYEVSILVDRQWQGLGVAKQALLRLRCMFGAATFHAEILPENIGSRRLFESCGYVQSGKGWYISNSPGTPTNDHL